MSRTKIIPLKDIERLACMRAVAKSASVSHAAKALGIARASLYRKMRRYGIKSRAKQEKAAK